MNIGIDYNNIHRVYGYRINTGFLAKTLATSITTYYLVYSLTKYLQLNPWIELIIGGTLSLTLYLTGIITTKALTTQDYQYIDNQATNLGPLAPIIHKTITKLTKPNTSQTQIK